MQSLKIGYKEILRAAKPGDVFWGTFIALCFATLIWCGGYAVYIHDRWMTWETSVAGDTLVQAIYRPVQICKVNTVK